MGKQSENNLFNQIEDHTNISSDEVFKVADSVKNANFSDEKTVRQLIRRLSKMANRPLPKTKEDEIVEMITNQNIPMDMNSLQQMLKK
ncbi:Stage VI sporulation protein F [Salinibacillus kushneri]|uniref:Stage VI sporulation protein F n=1 Tax=Salinibacillus kushneri TaxID=237682 RepID=A0A1I0I087_9BACI|nr:stage VI sporulation protein F [Salinibacillus kushneri]SET89920.1 Stage VI sporulation protein F [Salinibacillus kushneri]